MSATRGLVSFLAWVLVCAAPGPLRQAHSQAIAPGDTVRGASIYTRCMGCHAMGYDRTGPRHCGLFGRRAGTVKGFDYSDAMKKSTVVWNDETLNWFLKSPMTAIPGTAMGYAGIPDDQERADLIAYLKKENAGPDC